MQPDPSSLRIAAIDLNGQMRGKRMPADYLRKAEAGAVRMPLSTLNVDIWGADIDGSALVFETGDRDGYLEPTARGAVPMPWLAEGAVLVPATMLKEDKTPFEGDPRRALERVIERYTTRGWTVRAAFEMEFYLCDDNGAQPEPARNMLTGRRLTGSNLLSLSELDAFEPYFNALYSACEAMDIPAQSAICEAGRGQFEIDINHTDALEAADNATLFKALAKGLARQHDMAASFMAKPFAGDAGTGLHVHFSVVDEHGKNIFDDGSETGNDTLRHSVAGCLDAMRGSTLIFAPHGPSYDRFVDGAHAPTSICWGYENRTAALRIPAGPPVARRIEHRIAGGDTNPYLHLAAILGAAMNGIDQGKEPPAPVTGSAYDATHPELATDWTTAIDLFEADSFVAQVFHPRLIENMVMTKRQELRLLNDIAPAERWRSYLETV